MFRGRTEAALSMNIAEIAILILLVLSLAFQIIIARGNARMNAQGIQILDQNIAKALKSLLEQLPEAMKELAGSIEPIEQPNPIQMLIADMIQQQVNPALRVTQIQPKDPETGKFKKLEEF